VARVPLRRGGCVTSNSNLRGLWGGMGGASVGSLVWGACDIGHGRRRASRGGSVVFLGPAVDQGAPGGPLGLTPEGHGGLLRGPAFTSNISSAIHKNSGHGPVIMKATHEADRSANVQNKNLRDMHGSITKYAVTAASRETAPGVIRRLTGRRSCGGALLEIISSRGCGAVRAYVTEVETETRAQRVYFRKRKKNKLDAGLTTKHRTKPISRATKHDRSGANTKSYQHPNRDTWY